MNGLAPPTTTELLFFLTTCVLGFFGGVASNFKNVGERGSWTGRGEMMAGLLGSMVGTLAALLVFWKTTNSLLAWAATIGASVFADEIVELVPGYLRGAAEWLASKLGFKARPAHPEPDEPDPDPKP